MNSIPEENYHTAMKVICCLNKLCRGYNELYSKIMLFFHKCFFNFPEEKNFKMNKSFSFDIFHYMIENSDLLPHRYFKNCVSPLAELKSSNDEVLKPNLFKKKEKNNKNTKLKISKQIYSNSLGYPFSYCPKPNKKMLALMQVAKYLDLKDHLNCRIVSKKWNQFFTKFESLNNFFFVDFRVLLKWHSEKKQKMLAQKYKWSKNFSQEKGCNRASRFLFFSSLITFHTREHDLCFGETNKQKKNLKIAILGNKSSGKKSFLSHLGSFIDYHLIGKNECGIILEGKGKIGQSKLINLNEIIVSFTKIDQKNVKPLIYEKKLNDFDAFVVIASPENSNNFNIALQIDSSLRETLNEINSSAKLFRVLNKIDLLKDYRLPNIKIQSGDSKISLENYFPISVEKRINLESFFPFIFERLFSD